MKAMTFAVTTLTATTVATLATLFPSLVEAGHRVAPHGQHHWQTAYASARLARMALPVATVLTTDLSFPVARYVYDRLDDGYDYPIGYGEYALYGKWARDAYGRPSETRCRLVWFDGPRMRSLNRCN